MCRCSFVIPARNAFLYLGETLRSLLAQTVIPDEILVVDDGSTDETGELARSFGAGVRVLRRDGNHGASASRNLGIREAKGEFVGFLDADDLCHPRRVEAQLSSLEQDPEAALSFCDIAYIDASGNPSGITVAFDEFSREGFSGQLFERNRIATTSAVIARREALVALGGFDEALAFNEEYDLWLRAALRHPVAHVAEALVLYRIHEANISKSREGQRENERKALLKHSTEVIRSALRQAYGETTRARLAFAQVLFRMENFDLCEAELRACLPGQGDAPLHSFLSGNVRLARNDFEAAGDYFLKTLHIDPTFAPARNNLGIAKAKSGRVDEARGHFQAAAAMRSGYSDPLHNLAALGAGDCDSFRATFAPLRAALKPQ